VQFKEVALQLSEVIGSGVKEVDDHVTAEGIEAPSTIKESSEKAIDLDTYNAESDKSEAFNRVVICLNSSDEDSDDLEEIKEEDHSPLKKRIRLA